ncbi:MAG: histidine triad nucleotide-binding protein [Pirellulales bacterium]
MAKTVFKRIIEGDIPAQIVYDDDLCMAFHDVSPVAPIHILVIPKKEIRCLDDLVSEDAALLGHIMLVIAKLAKERNLNQGYRVVTNCGPHGGQSVDHLHFHLLAGRQMEWPPG